MNGIPADGTEELLRVRGVYGRAVAICRSYRVTLLEVLGVGRSSTITKARGHVAYELRQLGFSWPEIGSLMGRHQATVHSAANAHAKKSGLERV